MENKLIARYKFEDKNQAGKDSSDNGFHGEAKGSVTPVIQELDGRSAIVLQGGAHGTSYVELPKNMLESVGDQNGLTVTAWVHLGKNGGIWDRIFDFGKSQSGPYLFLTRNLRGVCNGGEDIAADPFTALSSSEWVHIAMAVSGTKGGTMSSAGPVIFLNGEMAADNRISQTTSGMYGKLRAWWKTFEDPDCYVRNYIGMSQFDVDGDFCGAISDFRIYQGALEEKEILEIMCESFSQEEMVELVVSKYLEEPQKLAWKNLELPTEYAMGRVQAKWKSSNPEAIAEDGTLGQVNHPCEVTLSVQLSCGQAQTERSFQVTVVPEYLVKASITIHGQQETMDVSKTLWGLFYEDINNAADGGIYAEMVQNRSFENFHFAVYDAASGENGASAGRVREPLFAWFGDLDQMEVQMTGGLDELFGLDDKDGNACYVTVKDGARIWNKGFCDANEQTSMYVKNQEAYDFTIWAKAQDASRIKVYLADAEGERISNEVLVEVEAGNSWKKYGVDSILSMTAKQTGMAELVLEFEGDSSIDMVSLFPEMVWGRDAGEDSSAHRNYVGNSNYRLRRDMVEALAELHPSFFRFPGGCISEGSYIWDNVYDWKDSVGPVEVRKENFNVWGYVMTLGLGYMEYFQLAEDLGAEPLPVMACGVLCQARSDYANPAGGDLMEKYINNFTDLIDFAISTDFEGNQWAALRRDMGHEEPFGLHYLGVGNENWGTEFMASFERFYDRIQKHMEEHYSGYPLQIISTAGAQADDDAYQDGWKFLSGDMKGGATVAFTDGEKSWDEDVTWYENKAHYMDTIVDEHYYRQNQYLLNNADRYDYYYRAYNADGSINDAESSKVFVGEYASSDKNTLAGAVAEAAVMTGFENNTDVVRMAATAPLFNKVRTDGLYRWTPDCIWFDDESVWRTPTYYVQQMFAKYLGTRVLATDFDTYQKGKAVRVRPRGGIELLTGNATVAVKNLLVRSNQDDSVLLEEDFTRGFKPGEEWQYIGSGKMEEAYHLDAKLGLVLHAKEEGTRGFYLERPEWENYRVEMTVQKLDGADGFYLGVGASQVDTDKKNALEYMIGCEGRITGIKVWKEGKEGYTMGDFSSSICAGNLRNARYDGVETGKEYVVAVNYGGEDGAHLCCQYKAQGFESRTIETKLNAYHPELFCSVTRDDNRIYLKVVNPDTFEKKTGFRVEDVKVEEKIALTTLTGDPALAGLADINKKQQETICPKETEAMVADGYCELVLPANSVTVVVYTIEK